MSSWSYFFLATVKAHNQAVVWDRIIRDKSDAKVKVQDGMNKYGFREVSKSFEWVSTHGGHVYQNRSLICLAYSNINSTTFILKWNVMPKVGILAYGDEAHTGSVEVPKKVVGEDGQRIKPEKMWY